MRFPVCTLAKPSVFTAAGRRNNFAEIIFHHCKDRHNWPKGQETGNSYRLVKQ
jgi:hypothetical protein